MKKDDVKSLAKRALREMMDPPISQDKNVNEGEADPEDIFDILDERAQPTMVPTANLKLDERYQFNPETEDGRLAKLKSYLKAKSGFSKQESGPIHISRRSPKYFKKGDLGDYILDGGGRWYMATKMVSEPLKEISAIIYDDLKSWEEEAAIFLNLNRHKRTIKKPHLFVVAANAGQEPEKTILKIVNEHGYCIERKTNKRGAIFAASSVFFAHHLGVLDRALHIIRGSWEDQKKLDGRHLVALSAVLATNPFISNKRLIEKFKKWPAKDAQAIARRKAQVDISTRNPQSRDTNPYLAREFITKYNSRIPNTMERAKARNLDEVPTFFTDREQYKDVWEID